MAAGRIQVQVVAVKGRVHRVIQIQHLAERVIPGRRPVPAAVVAAGARGIPVGVRLLARVVQRANLAVTAER